MFETEANSAKESTAQIPEEILKKFIESSEKIKSRSLIYWGEHCTECNWPSCYTSCELYSPRNDLKCRQFVDGAVRLELPGSINSYLLKIKFKRWGKIWALGSTKLFSNSQAVKLEKIDFILGSSVQKIPAPPKLKSKIIGKYSYIKRNMSDSEQLEGTPTHFVVECYNPNPFDIQMTLTIKNRNSRKKAADPNCAVPSLINFQKLLKLKKGYNYLKVPFSEIQSRVDFNQAFEVEMTPNNLEDGTVLVFGLTDFIESAEKENKKICKCVIWDLDNTMWNGILIEDGAEKLKLKSGIKDVIIELDKRGILNSIATKNNEKETLEVLNDLGLTEYFLYPKITWEPKSTSIANICKQLNIGRDSVFFIDDQKFEREEVSSVLPEVTCVDASEYLNLLDMPEFQVPVTEESKKRRSMYKEQLQREVILQSHNGDYIEFLKSCELTVYLSSLSKSNIDRIYELAQRTNQMNFSGNRYEKSELQNFMKSAEVDTYVIRGSDKFGSYGIVGFGIIDVNEPRLVDLLFSCRIQSKKVEHEVIRYFVKKYSNGSRDFYVNYKKTEKNKASGKVFYDLGFEEVGIENGITSLKFTREKVMDEEGIVTIEAEVEKFDYQDQ
jgi:FkbH-like protein